MLKFSNRMMFESTVIETEGGGDVTKNSIYECILAIR